MTSPEHYRTPPTSISDVIDAPPTPAASLCPNNRWLALCALPSHPAIEELAQPEVRLAGLRINPRTFERSRLSHYTGIELIEIDTQKKRTVTGLPDGARLRRLRWSPNGEQMACTEVRDGGAAIWLIDVATASARRLFDGGLNATVGAVMSWTPDGGALIVRLLPKDLGAAPEPPEVPPGPITQENLGRKTPARTYQDLLTGPHDEALFEHYLSAQMARLSLDGKLTHLGPPGLIWRTSPSPDNRYLLVSVVHRPYSYRVPVGRFPRRLELWGADGSFIKVFADLPLAEEIPIGFSATRTGPRSLGWRGDKGAELRWVEAQDGGDPEIDVEVRDNLYTLPAPFDGEPVLLMGVGSRLTAVLCGSDALAIVYEAWWKTRRVKCWILEPGDSEVEPRLLYDRSWEDRYNDPGQPAMTLNALGRPVLHTTDGGRSIFLIGEGASPEGNRPFLDRMALDTGQCTRLWRSSAPFYESPIEILDEDGARVLMRRESADTPPNFYIRSMADGELTAITSFSHPYPMLGGVTKELLRYERDDGVGLTGTLYLPEGYDAERDGPLPTILWAYPREFKSADAAGQVRDSPYRFIRVGWYSPMLWLAEGFAVLDDPAMPIVGEGEAEPNETFIEQLVGSARAAIDTLAQRGVTDRRRVAVGGHSYGAFMTANLLAHSDLFAAGIARSGAFNRTLTPFGFQAEERTLWQTPETYFSMSPFMHADKITAPILLIHGAEDNNSGTYPMQSERFYDALKGHGATARLVMLPHESHAYRARESILHMAWEMDVWLKTYVKDSASQGDD